MLISPESLCHSDAFALVLISWTYILTDFIMNLFFGKFTIKNWIVFFLNIEAKQF